ncbi:MAG: choice-of-anchor L domain-containing protein, partial [Cryomorphaceae bacterium]
MKKFTSILIRFAFLICCMTGFYANAQINITNGQTAAELAQEIVGDGVTITNAQITCADNGFGIFSNGNVTNIGLDGGIVLTTGLTSDIPGENNSDATSRERGTAGDADLAAIVGETTLDACVLTFDFVPTDEFITVDYVFGSEEYVEWVCSQYNDVFAFLVNGPNPAGGNYVNQNVAIVPTSTLAVAINSVNNGTPGLGQGTDPFPVSNCESLSLTDYYVNNPVGAGTTIEYDGFTVVLSSQLEVIPNQSYTFKFAIADVSDRLWDSGVFIKASSFSSFDCSAGNITPGSDEVCLNDADNASVTVTSSGVIAGDTYEYLLTNTSGDILAIQAGNTFNFSDLCAPSYN